MNPLLNINEHKTSIAKAIAEQRTLIISLCADWCDNCDEWKSQFISLTLAEKQHKIWLDIDDHADMIADIDTSILPVLVIYKTNKIAFCGAVRPDLVTVSTLIRASSPDKKLVDPGILSFFMEDIEENSKS